MRTTTTLRFSTSPRFKPRDVPPDESDENTAIMLTADQQVTALRKKCKNAQDVGLIDLFCGCGGFTAGAQLAGMRVIKGFDLDKNKLDTYNKLTADKGLNYTITSAEELFQKIQSLVKENNETHVHVHASPPCVDVSSGNRSSGKGKTSYRLFCVVIDTLIMCAAESWFFSYSIEDGYEVTTKSNQDGQLMYLDKLSELRRHLFEIGWSNDSTAVVEAAYYGLPQSRKRFYATGCRDNTVQLPFNGIETMLTKEDRLRASDFWKNKAQVKEAFAILLDRQSVKPPTSMKTALQLYLGDEFNDDYWKTHHGMGTHETVFQSKPKFWNWEKDGTVDVKKRPTAKRERNRFDELARNLYELDKISHSFTKTFGQQWVFVDSVERYDPKLKETRTIGGVEEFNKWRKSKKKPEIFKDTAKFSFKEMKPSDMLPGELKALGGFPKDFELTGTQKSNQECVGDSVPPLMALLLASPIVKSDMNAENIEALLVYVYNEPSFSKRLDLLDLFEDYLKNLKTLSRRTVHLYTNEARKFINNEHINFVVQYETADPNPSHRVSSSAMKKFADFRTTAAFEEWMKQNESVVMEQFGLSMADDKRYATLLRKEHPDKNAKTYWVWGEKEPTTRAELNDRMRTDPKQLLYVVNKNLYTKRPRNKQKYKQYEQEQVLDCFTRVVKYWKNKATKSVDLVIEEGGGNAALTKDKEDDNAVPATRQRGPVTMPKPFEEQIREAKRQEKKLQKYVKVETVPGQGKGLIAQQDLDEGFRIYYYGKYRHETDKTPLSQYVVADPNGSGWQVDGGDPRIIEYNIAGRVNHAQAYRANADLNWDTSIQQPYVEINEIGVEGGEQITMDYGITYDLDRFGGVTDTITESEEHEDTGGDVIDLNTIDSSDSEYDLSHLIEETSDDETGDDE